MPASNDHGDAFLLSASDPNFPSFDVGVVPPWLAPLDEELELSPPLAAAEEILELDEDPDDLDPMDMECLDDEEPTTRRVSVDGDATYRRLAMGGGYSTDLAGLEGLAPEEDSLVLMAALDDWTESPSEEVLAADEAALDDWTESPSEEVLAADEADIDEAEIDEAEAFAVEDFSVEDFSVEDFSVEDFAPEELLHAEEAHDDETELDRGPIDELALDGDPDWATSTGDDTGEAEGLLVEDVDDLYADEVVEEVDPHADTLSLDEDTQEVFVRAFVVDGLELDGESMSMAHELPPSLTGAVKPCSLSIVEDHTSDLQVSLINRARAEIADGNIEGAELTLERADELRPGLPVVMVHQAWVMLLNGERFYAGMLASQAAELAPQDTLVADLAASIVDENGDSMAG